jgi:hypothetical protein
MIILLLHCPYIILPLMMEEEDYPPQRNILGVAIPVILDAFVEVGFIAGEGVLSSICCSSREPKMSVWVGLETLSSI